MVADQSSAEIPRLNQVPHAGLYTLPLQNAEPLRFFPAQVISTPLITTLVDLTVADDDSRFSLGSSSLQTGWLSPPQRSSQRCFLQHCSFPGSKCFAKSTCSEQPDGIPDPCW